MESNLRQIQEAITSWPGITTNPHRFGGLEYNLGKVEVGHIHLNGMVDIPFNRKIRDQLIAEGYAEPHHLLSDTGWITFYVRSETDVAQAIWLFRLSYLFYATRGQNRAVLAGKVNVTQELEALDLSEGLRTIFDKLMKKV